MERLLEDGLQFCGCGLAYHLNKAHWNSIILDGTIPEKEIRRMIGESYDLTKKERKG